VDDRSPTSRGRELADLLRELRVQAGLTVEDVARQLRRSPAKIGSIETASPAASPKDVRELAVLYRVDDQQFTRLLALAREAKQRGWWEEYEDLGIGRLIGLAAEATELTSFESSVIPWMFQTEEYARAVIKGILPGIADHILNERVEARLRRQELLTREAAPTFWSLVDEMALLRPVGDSTVMGEQLRKMAETAATVPGITLQVVPLSAGAHPGLDNSFTLLEFPSSQPAVVYVENITGSQYLNRASDLDRYREALKYLDKHALSVEDSRQLIEELDNSPISR